MFEVLGGTPLAKLSFRDLPYPPRSQGVIPNKMTLNKLSLPKANEISSNLKVFFRTWNLAEFTLYPKIVYQKSKKQTKQKRNKQQQNKN